METVNKIKDWVKAFFDKHQYTIFISWIVITIVGFIITSSIGKFKTPKVNEIHNTLIEQLEKKQAQDIKDVRKELSDVRSRYIKLSDATKLYIIQNEKEKKDLRLIIKNNKDEADKKHWINRNSTLDEADIFLRNNLEKRNPK